MILKDEVKHVAKLARLGLNSREIEKMQKELSAILEYIEKLKEVNISKVEPTYHSIKVENVVREDKAREDRGERRVRKLLDLTPKIKEDYLKVKSILK